MFRWIFGMNDTPRVLKTQVIIIGAGPTGLSMAAQLVRHKIDFILIDKKEKTTTFSKAIVVQARTLEIFSELGIGQRAINEGRLTTALNLFYQGKRRAAINLSGLGEGLSPYPFALSLEQSKTESLLADHLAENGKQVKWNTEFSRLEQLDNGVTAYCKTNNGQELRLDADYLVGCDGAGSLLRHQLGLSFEGSTEPKLFYVADVILSSPVINKDELFMYMIKKGFVLFFPMEGMGHYRIVGVIPDAKDTDEEYTFDSVKPIIIRQIISPVDFKEIGWFSTYKVHSRKTNEFMKRRCFIAGDAAHIHTPAGGQGMNTGIQDAYNLAWKIAYALRGEINEDTLETYNGERKENARRLLRTTDRMFDIMSGINPFWNFLRLNFFPPFLGLITKNKTIQKQIFPLISQTGIGYPRSFLTIKSSIANVKAGYRMPYFVFSNGKEIFSYLLDPVFKLLFFGDKNKNDSEELKNPKIKMLLLSFGDIPHSIFGDASNFYILLRPDNHISYIGKEIGRCKELLNKISHR
jgi:2-polyprenyl-6-methoxyphenol hydroxylase-like FAD-dependent oxidoreductase